MSYHIVSIDSANCSLSCRDGQLTCKTAEGERKLPLEDVASILITSFSAHIHSHLFLEAAKHGVALIICEAFKPVSLVLPANRSTDTLLTRAVLNLPQQSREQLWRRTVDAKCENQVALAAHIKPDTPRLTEMKATAMSRKIHKEAIVAKSFWKTFGESLGDNEFTRSRAGGGLNSLLNYGYAVLLSTVLQKLFGVGLDPTFGISHLTRERSTPLAYDLMEPFRPCVDWRVYQWVKQQQPKLGSSGHQSAPSAAAPESLSELTSTAMDPEKNCCGVTKEFRKWVTAFPLEKIGYLDFTLELQGVIEGVVRGFRRAILENNPRPPGFGIKAKRDDAPAQRLSQSAPPGFGIKAKRRAFLSSCVAMIALMTLFGLEMFPHMVLSNPPPANSLTIYNAASSPQTLGIMLTIAMIGVPIVLTYTVSIYWIFRGKVKLDRMSY